MRLRIVPALGVLASLLAHAGVSAETTTVTVTKYGSVFSIEAASAVNASIETAWNVLADYESYPGFVPNLNYSIRIGDNPVRVEQRGDFRVLFFRRDVHVLLEIEENPPGRIVFRAFGGNLKTLVTEISIEANGRSTRVRYKSTIEPEFWVPPLITAAILRTTIRSKLQAVADEITRRAAESNAAP